MNEAIIAEAANNTVNGATRRIQRASFIGLTVEKLLPNEIKGIKTEIRVQAVCPFTSKYKDLPESILRQLETCGVPQDKLFKAPYESPEIKNKDKVWRKYPVKGFTVEANFNIVESNGNLKMVTVDWSSVTLVKQEYTPIRTTTFSL